MKTFVLAFAVLALLAGCGGVPYSNPYASPDTSSQRDCELSGGSHLPTRMYAVHAGTAPGSITLYLSSQPTCSSTPWNNTCACGGTGAAAE